MEFEIPDWTMERDLEAIESLARDARERYAWARWDQEHVRPKWLDQTSTEARTAYMIEKGMVA